MESIAVAKVYARRHRYEVEPNRELIGLGAANVASGLFGGYPVTGGFSRTAVNDTAGARTPLASIITAGIVLLTIAFLTPLLSSLPNAALGAIIIMAVIGLVDIAEMRHIARVKKSDLIGLSRRLRGHAGPRHRARHRRRRRGVDARRVRPDVDAPQRRARPCRRHDQLPQRRSLPRGPHRRGRPDRPRRRGAVVRQRHQRQASSCSATPTPITDEPRALVLDASGINDIDATGSDMLSEVLVEFDERDVDLHLTDVKGPVRDVLRRAGIWDRLGDRSTPRPTMPWRPSPAIARHRSISGSTASTSDRRTAASPARPRRGSMPDDTWAELVAAHERSRPAAVTEVPEHAPKAAILACSDARVPPSVVFDQPAGALFVVRIAGNTASPAALASLDYAVEHLGVDARHRPRPQRMRCGRGRGGRHLRRPSRTHRRADLCHRPRQPRCVARPPGRLERRGDDVVADPT